MNLQATAPPPARLVFPGPALFAAAIWTWAIWSCAEHWEANSNYSYGWAVPLLAAGFALRRFWLLSEGDPVSADPTARFSPAFQFLAAIAMLVVVFALEYRREQIWHPMIVLWSICLIAVLSTLGLFYLAGGQRLARAELFPVAFLLSAVPWPPRFEQPLTGALMKWVAGATAELLHWFGIEAQTSGGAIALHSGLVGITEACSGVRSLQAGIMFGLAMGEWFLLRPLRRIVLVAIAVGLALATNLLRTVLLAVQAERHGIESVDRVHDLIGNVMITALIVAIWIGGRLLSSGHQRLLAINHIKDRTSAALRGFISRTTPLAGPLAVAILIGIIGARAVTAKIEAADQTQTAAFFVTKRDDSNQPRQLPRDVLNELHPTTADYIRHVDASLPRGGADCFHFFWKPSPWNRFALVHRPDICMPGIGWTQIDRPKPVDVTLNGRPVRCQLFRFQRGNVYAVELWGVWRNGEPLSIDYEPAQVLGAAPPPASLHFEGKRRSATEIVACTLISEDISPSDDMAVALLPSVFEYRPQ